MPRINCTANKIICRHGDLIVPPSNLEKESNNIQKIRVGIISVYVEATYPKKRLKIKPKISANNRVQSFMKCMSFCIMAD